jgi:hypothetical protein
MRFQSVVIPLLVAGAAAKSNLRWRDVAYNGTDLASPMDVNGIESADNVEAAENVDAADNVEAADNAENADNAEGIDATGPKGGGVRINSVVYLLLDPGLT